MHIKLQSLCLYFQIWTNNLEHILRIASYFLFLECIHIIILGFFLSHEGCLHLPLTYYFILLPAIYLIQASEDNHYLTNVKPLLSFNISVLVALSHFVLIYAFLADLFRHVQSKHHQLYSSLHPEFNRKSCQQL